MDRGGVRVELVVKLRDAFVGGLTNNGSDGGKREAVNDFVDGRGHCKEVVTTNNTKGIGSRVKKRSKVRCC
jgi:hypothetical protein